MIAIILIATTTPYKSPYWRHTEMQNVERATSSNLQFKCNWAWYEPKERTPSRFALTAYPLQNAFFLNEEDKNSTIKQEPFPGWTAAKNYYVRSKQNLFIQFGDNNRLAS